MSDPHAFPYDVVVIGGAGHVGFPLAVAFASRGLRTCIYDINEVAVSAIAAGTKPFLEPGAQLLLDEAVASRSLVTSNDPAVIALGEHVIVVVGTPVDEHLTPDTDAVPRAIEEVRAHLRSGQLVVLRSTVSPGVTKRVASMLREHALDVDLAFCPERIAEGRAMTELFELPQIVSGQSAIALQRAGSLFGKLTTSIVEVTPEEAELVKLFTNSWRYIKFAAANQFFMMANDHGLDFERIRSAMSYDYPRAADVPRAGFTAGPCLLKDTMQLAVTDNAFALGQSAMLVNEGLPGYVVSRLEKAHELSELTVGILGMAFKAESDDTRSSLSYQLKRLLRSRAGAVLTTDPYVTTDSDLLPLDEVIARSDLLVVAAPHRTYAGLSVDVPVVDIWDMDGKGVLI